MSLNEGTSGCEGRGPAFLPSFPPPGWARLGAPVNGAVLAPGALPAAADRGGPRGRSRCPRTRCGSARLRPAVREPLTRGAAAQAIYLRLPSLKTLLSKLAVTPR